MTLFDKLLVAHLVGDWLLQTEWQALNKGKNFQALLTHVAVYSLTLLAVLVTTFGFSNLSIYIIVLILGLIHALMDGSGVVAWYIRTFKLIDKRGPEKWLSIAVDQVFHILLIAGAALLLSN